MRQIQTQPLTAAAFAPFGDVIELKDAADFMINGGACGRHHDLAQMDFGTDGRAGISIADSQHTQLPLDLGMVERHPDGSQAFVPLTQNPFLVVVAPDENGTPGIPMAFVAQPGQGVNYHRNIWHGVLMPLGGQSQFLIVDRIGNTPNLEEHFFDIPYQITE
ncbi:MAG: ureidoglycolate lyase [Planktomarina sp.]